MAYRFQLVDAETHGPKHPNEDAHGAASRTAWIIDGATGVGAGPDLFQPSGAAWLAQLLSAALAESAAHPAGLDDLLAGAAERISAAFADTAGHAALDLPDHPSACLGVARLDGDEVHLACIGDVSLVHASTSGEVHLFTDESVAAVSARTMGSLKAALAQFPGQDPWPLVREQVRANRLLANQPGGYGVVHPTLSWTDRVLRAQRRVEEGDMLLLATDGFWRLVDHFDLHSPASLVDAALRQGLPRLIGELRDAERADPAGTVAPRVKMHDDATALLLRVVADED